MSDLTDLITRHLGAYNYPACYIEACDTKSDLSFGGGFYGRYVQTKEVTSSALDAHHSRLLWSENPAENMIGLASVIYWGFYTFGDNYARKRVNWFVNGARRSCATDPSIVAIALRECRQHLAAGAYGRALQSIGNLNQLGRTPFASKVIAFMAPDGAGVYDNRIARGIAHHPIASRNSLCKGQVLFGTRQAVGPVYSEVIASRYQNWCSVLQVLAQQIGSDHLSMKIRAIDIERSLFAAFRGIPPLGRDMRCEATKHPSQLT